MPWGNQLDPFHIFKTRIIYEMMSYHGYGKG